MVAGGLKPWQYSVLVVSCVGSMLAGASVVHRIFPPDLVSVRLVEVTEPSIVWTTENYRFWFRLVTANVRKK